MNLRHAAVGGVLTVLFGASGSAESLRFDPFSRPARHTETESSRPSTEVWRPILRGTLLAGADSLANLGGVLLSQGESYGGYRLKSVQRFEAVFERGGEEIVLPVTKGDAP